MHTHAFRQKPTLKNVLRVLFISFFVFSQTLHSQEKNEDLVRFYQNWVEFDVYEEGLKGARIHTEFTVYNLKGISASLAIALEYDTGEKVYAINSNYKSTNGQLSVYKKLNLTYAESVFKDISLFVPYRELNIGYGTHKLRFHVDLLYGGNNGTKGNNIHMSYYDFTYTK